jgi:peptidoglycan/LPS O-acetylase OafA/YrhL
MSAVVREFNSRAPKLGAVKAFDGIRGVGVWLVLLQHAYAVADSLSGYIDLFFVLSGFLITTLIFEERRSTGDVSLRNFYARRGIRLLPSLIVVLIVGWIPIALFARDLLRQVTEESIATLFYVHNIFFSPLLGSAQYMGQMWSLSLEEQFYLVGAVATYVCLKRGWIRPLGAVLAGFILFVWVARAMGHGGPGQFWFQRPDAIALGVLLAIIHAEMPTQLSPKGAKRLLIAAWVSAVGFAFAMASSSKLVDKLIGFYVPLYPTDVDIEVPDNMTREQFHRVANEAIQQVLAQLPDGNYWARWGFTLATASAAVMCLAFVRLRDDFALSRWLSGRMLGYFGALSYAMYISHYQLFKLLDPAGNGGPKWIPIKLFAAFLVGAALHRWVEKPALKKLRHRFTHHPVQAG